MRPCPGTGPQRGRCDPGTMQQGPGTGAVNTGAMEEMGKVARAGLGLAVVAMLAGGTAGVAQAQAKDQGKQLSDKSVQTLVNYAWAMTPAKFTAPDGKVIEVDKSKPQEVIVPLDVAREVIRVAWYSARAQRCNLEEEQRANYQTLMKREQGKKWTEQQLLFIHELHLFTVMYSAGKVKIVANDENGKDVVINDQTNKPQEPCTDAERQTVQKAIMAYVSSEPTPAAAPEKKK